MMGLVLGEGIDAAEVLDSYLLAEPLSRFMEMISEFLRCWVS